MTYTFFTDNTCTGTGASAGTGTLNGDGTVPNSNIQGPLQAGSYSFLAAYSGDANYTGSTSSCEPFAVAQGSAAAATTVFDAATNTAWAATETVGASAYDTATVTGAVGVTPTGTVTYTFFTNNTCTATGTAAGTVTLTGTGVVPNSNIQGPLAVGSYSFLAAYSGDVNYTGSTSSCEPFAVAQGTAAAATTVFDAATNAAWAGTEKTGASAFDTATLTGAGGVTPSGTVTYTFFTNNTCAGTGTATGTVTLNGDATVPNSNIQGPLAAGGYAFQAAYSGDANYTALTSGCEPFAVGQLGPGTATVVFDAASGAAWVGTEKTGASAYDTATVTGAAGVTPTGTVTYTFFTNKTCTATGIAAGTVTLTGAGAVPNSNIQGPLQAGSYSFLAAYSGDANYTASTSSCEPFSVLQGSAAAATTVFDAATNAAWAGTETVGASAYDTATVTGAGGVTPTGTVTYTFFTNIACSGTGASAGTVTLTGAGAVPNSNIQGPLAAGDYAFWAVYSGDANYTGSTSSCEPFSLVQASTTAATTVFDAATNSAWAGTEKTGASAYDTATVTGTAGVTPTGTVTYTFFIDNACTVTGVSAGTVTLNGDGTVPNSKIEGPLQAGSYSFLAVYSGDANYTGSTSSCEPFAVAQGSAEAATTVFDAAINAAWAGTETVGASAYDTTTVTPSADFTATGTVTYTFFTNNACTGAGVSAGTVTLNGDGTVPNSNIQGPLAVGWYSFLAVYSGDANYTASTSSCEPFAVAQGGGEAATTVFDAATGAAWVGTEKTGASAFDTATVTGAAGVTPTGTVTYTFFTDNACTGTGTAAGTVTLTGPGWCPTRTSKGRWRWVRTVFGPRIPVTPTTPVRRAPASRSPWPRAARRLPPRCSMRPPTRRGRGPRPLGRRPTTRLRSPHRLVSPPPAR